jgi:hypothetical protein
MSRIDHTTPGALVNDLFPRTWLARNLHVSESTIWRWGQPVPKGTGGLIPSRYHCHLLLLAQERGADLTAQDLVLGRGQAAPA